MRRTVQDGRGPLERPQTACESEESTPEVLTDGGSFVVDWNDAEFGTNDAGSLEESSPSDEATAGPEDVDLDALPFESWLPARDADPDQSKPPGGDALDHEPLEAALDAASDAEHLADVTVADVLAELSAQTDDDPEHLEVTDDDALESALAGLTLDDGDATRDGDSS